MNSFTRTLIASQLAITQSGVSRVDNSTKGMEMPSTPRR